MHTSTVKQVKGPVFVVSSLQKRVVVIHQAPPFFNRIYQLVSLPILQVACALLVCGYLIEAQAQTLQARIVVNPSTPAKLQIQLEFPFEIDGVSFLNSYAGILGLAQRIGALEAASAAGEPVRVEKAAPGELRFARKVKKLAYEVDVTEPTPLENMSHISWVNRERGLLMPADVLPRVITTAGDFSIVRISIEVPSGWTIRSNIDRDGNDAFVTSEPDKVVFLIGSNLAEASANFGSNKFRLITSGDWPFSGGEALRESRRILEEYARVTGVSLKSDSYLMLVPFPENTEQGRWTAEARGNAVVMLMPRRGSRKALIRRLGILLSHELFHLWVPNSLRLQGDYDWFFEGFTLYQALLTDVRLGFISFADYLETIGRVYVSYLSSRDANEQSLIEASEQRWTRSPSLVYDKGMLVAFIYDLTIRSRTNCKESISDVYKDLFRSHSTGQGNANEIIIRLLSGRGGMDAFVKNYVEGRGDLDFEAQLLRYGLQFRPNEARPRFGLSTNLMKEHKELLGCLGYKS